LISPTASSYYLNGPYIQPDLIASAYTPLAKFDLTQLKNENGVRMDKELIDA
jgi:hypothetical protein